MEETKQKEDFTFLDIDFYEYLNLVEDSQQPLQYCTSNEVEEDCTLVNSNEEPVSCSELDVLDEYPKDLFDGYLKMIAGDDKVEKSPKSLMEMSEGEFRQHLHSLNLSARKMEQLVAVRSKLLEKKNESITKIATLSEVYSRQSVQCNNLTDVQEIGDISQEQLETIENLANQFLNKMLIKETTDTSTGRRRARNNHLPQEAKNILYQWFLQNVECPYPSKEEKAYLAAQANITEKQLETWFINIRMRRWKPIKDKHVQL